MRENNAVRPGIYALASTDGAPLDPADLALLGLTGDPLWIASGLAVTIVDPQPHSISVHQSHEALTVFAGYLDEPEDLGASLSLAPDTPSAALAAAALQRFAADAPHHMLGQWSFLRWEPAPRRLTLLTSQIWRDRMYFATHGPRIAVAPEMQRLCALPWVGRQIDPHSFALELGRASIRPLQGGNTLWKGVSRVQPATCEIFTSDGHQTLAPAPPPAIELWRGSFDDAVDAMSTLLRRIVAQHVERHGRTACLLSGGLDSTLLTAFAHQVAPAGVLTVSSVAPEGSGLPDERHFIQAVTSSLGIEGRLVCPPADASPFQLSARMLAWAQGPMAGLRPYLYDTLWQTASYAGASAVIDGVGGELSITRKPPRSSEAGWLRRLWTNARYHAGHRRLTADWPQDAFHARLSPQLLHSIPSGWADSWLPTPKPPRYTAGQPSGIHPAVAKSAAIDAYAPNGLRNLRPFLDFRLLRLAASFPAEFGTHHGQTRAVARAMLLGRVPEEVRLRRSRADFSPDYWQRLHGHARAARERVPLFRAAGAAEWLDLDWLENALRTVEQTPKPGIHAYTAQLTAIAAEFLLSVR